MKDPRLKPATRQSQQTARESHETTESEGEEKPAFANLHSGNSMMSPEFQRRLEIERRNKRVELGGRLLRSGTPPGFEDPGAGLRTGFPHGTEECRQAQEYVKQCKAAFRREQRRKKRNPGSVNSSEANKPYTRKQLPKCHDPTRKMRRIAILKSPKVPEREIDDVQTGRRDPVVPQETLVTQNASRNVLQEETSQRQHENGSYYAVRNKKRPAEMMEDCYKPPARRTPGGEDGHGTQSIEGKQNTPPERRHVQIVETPRDEENPEDIDKGRAGNVEDEENLGNFTDQSQNHVGELENQYNPEDIYDESVHIADTLENGEELVEQNDAEIVCGDEDHPEAEKRPIEVEESGRTEEVLWIYVAEGEHAVLVEKVDMVKKMTTVNTYWLLNLWLRGDEFKGDRETAKLQCFDGPQLAHDLYHSGASVFSKPAQKKLRRRFRLWRGFLHEFAENGSHWDESDALRSDKIHRVFERARDLSTTKLTDMTWTDVNRLFYQWLKDRQFEEDRKNQKLWRVDGLDLSNDLFGSGSSRFSAAAQEVLRANFAHGEVMEVPVKSEAAAHPVALHGEFGRSNDQPDSLSERSDASTSGKWRNRYVLAEGEEKPTEGTIGKVMSLSRSKTSLLFRTWLRDDIFEADRHTQQTKQLNGRGLAEDLFGNEPSMFSVAAQRRLRTNFATWRGREKPMEVEAAADPVQFSGDSRRGEEEPRERQVEENGEPMEELGVPNIGNVGGNARPDSADINEDPVEEELKRNLVNLNRFKVKCLCGLAFEENHKAEHDLVENDEAFGGPQLKMAVFEKGSHFSTAAKKTLLDLAKRWLNLC